MVGCCHSLFSSLDWSLCHSWLFCGSWIPQQEIYTRVTKCLYGFPSVLLDTLELCSASWVDVETADLLPGFHQQLAGGAAPNWSLCHDKGWPCPCMIFLWLPHFFAILVPPWFSWWGCKCGLGSRPWWRQKLGHPHWVSEGLWPPQETQDTYIHTYIYICMYIYIYILPRLPHLSLLFFPHFQASLYRLVHRSNIPSVLGACLAEMCCVFQGYCESVGKDRMGSSKTDSEGGLPHSKEEINSCAAPCKWKRRGHL
jgi:hypothetical protein